MELNYRTGYISIVITAIAILYVIPSLITSQSSSEITSLVAQIKQRLPYKIFSLRPTYKSLRYIKETFLHFLSSHHTIQPTRSFYPLLCSCHSPLLPIPTCELKISHRSFYFRAPALWNALQSFVYHRHTVDSMRICFHFFNLTRYVHAYTTYLIFVAPIKCEFILYFNFHIVLGYPCRQCV